LGQHPTPNSEETPVVQILNPNNSDNDVQLVEPVKDTATSEIATDITETPIQHALFEILRTASRKDICRDGIIEMLRLVSFTASIWFLQK
jgi:hypothetical protein